MLTLKEVTDFLIYAGAVAGALAAIGLFLRLAIVRPMRKWITQQLVPPIAKIHDEVTPNSGHSMKDDVTGTRAEVDDLKTLVNKHLAEEVPADRREVDRLRTMLEMHLHNHPGGS